MKKDGIINYFNGKTGSAICRISDAFFEDIQEIRMRVNQPLSVWTGNKVCFITADGQLTYNAKSAVRVSEQDICHTFEAICQYSIHSFRREITDGFITVRGGHRIGICGTIVIQNGRAEYVKNISSLNFRIAREITGCADELYDSVFANGLCNVLVAGTPSSGKTTILRDLSRILGEKYKVSVIDERGEIAAVWNGIPQNNVGINTDIFNGYDKPTGIMTAIRVMSPQIIICDEIGSDADFTALNNASNCGVYTAASIHAGSVEELKCKGIKLDMFDKIVILSGCGKISQIIRRNEKGYA